MAVFNRRKTDHLLWQPRLNHWYEVNKKRGTLPKKYADQDILKIYDDLEASPRAYHFFNDTIKCIEGDKVRLQTRHEIDYIYTKYLTPVGSLTQVERRTEWGVTSLRTEYFLKNAEDFKVLSYILENQVFEFDKKLYKEREELLGNRSEPMITLPWSSIQRLFIVYMGFEKSVITLWKHRAKVENLLQVFEQNDDKRLGVLKKTPFKIVNFGDNIDEGLCSPPLFERYMLPNYQKRTKELHEAGKLCTSHWDGNLKKILHFARKTGLDGLECVPPEPQGNVTLEELKQGINGMILIDGIPATHFLSLTSCEELESFVNRLLDLFVPHIILGISDMLPPDGDIEKVRKIGKIIANYEI